MLSPILTGSVVGLDAHLVYVEADIYGGLPKFIVVGLPDTSVSESRDRVTSAIKQSGISFPRTHVTVNLAPADLKKSGTPFDLPIALAILCAQGDLPRSDGKKRLFAGELGLDGSLRPIRGALSYAILAKEIGIEELILPVENAREAALVADVPILSARCLSDVVRHLQRRHVLPTEPARTDELSRVCSNGLDFSAIRGQEQARRVLEIAAAGGHNLILQGPPGSGKTLLARTFSSILPRMTTNEVLETTRIHSVAGVLPESRVVAERPFRAPHHSASMPSLVGGGSIPKPGEISLAHHGVLFLDEFLEFSRGVLESLRQPLEDGFVTVSRVQGTILFPARFSLVAAMNPCPCGFMTDEDQRCTCSPIQILKYRKRLSGPLLDRIDLFIEVPKVKTNDLTDRSDAESSESIQLRVQKARDRQTIRFKSDGLSTNAELSSNQVRKFLKITDKARELLQQAVERYHLSARSYFRLLKVSQTIADLANVEEIDIAQLAEALQYRQDLKTT